MNIQKKKNYTTLVKKRKDCNLCNDLCNPSEFPQFDTSEIGPWSLWHNDLDADVLLVGQDWGGVDYFIKHKGRDEDSNPTNNNLVTLFRSIGISIEGPESGKKNSRLFFTNIILCLKKGGLTSPIQQKYATRCCSHFLVQLIDIIRPRVVIALGKFAYESIVKSYNLKIFPFRDAVECLEGFQIRKNIRLFPVYHCGARGWNINRKGPMQIEDWGKIKKYLGTSC